MPETMKSQAQWVDTVKNMCQSCHALGTRGIREIPKVFTDGYDVAHRLGDPHPGWSGPGIHGDGYRQHGAG